MCVCVVDCLHDVKSISQREWRFLLCPHNSNFKFSPQQEKEKKCGAARFFFFALWGIRNEKFIYYFFLSTTQIDASGGRMREILKTTTTKQKAEAIQAPDSRHRSVGGRGTPAVFNLVTALARSFPAAPACCLVGSSKSY